MLALKLVEQKNTVKESTTSTTTMNANKEEKRSR
jgi:hypothetical protein